MEGLGCPTLLGTGGKEPLPGKAVLFLQWYSHWQVDMTAASESKPRSHAITVKPSTAHIKQGMGMKRGFVGKNGFFRRQRRVRKENKG